MGPPGPTFKLHDSLIDSDIFLSKDIEIESDFLGIRCRIWFMESPLLQDTNATHSCSKTEL